MPPLPPGDSVHGELGVGFEKQRDVLDLCFSRRISVIASALGPPPPYMIEQARSKDVKVAALAGTVEHATRHVEAGVDIVVAQGYEAGGHTGEISTMVLVPEVVDAVAPVPVLAAGGIGNGRQIDGGARARRAGRLDRLGLAHDRRGRDAPGREAEVPERDLVRHGPLALA